MGTNKGPHQQAEVDIVSVQSSDTTFKQPSLNERRRLWDIFMPGCDFSQSKPYFPTLSKDTLRDVKIYPVRGQPVILKQLIKLAVVEFSDTEFGICDGYQGVRLKISKNSTTVKEQSLICFQDGWQQTDQGVIGLDQDGTLIHWPEIDTEKVSLHPDSFTYMYNGYYLHNSLSVITRDRIDVWTDPDRLCGNNVVVNFKENESFTILDSTLPTRPLRVFRQGSDSLWRCDEELVPEPLHPIDCTPYGKHIEYLHHVPLAVEGKCYFTPANVSVCVGRCRRDPTCAEIYTINDHAEWSRVSQWREPRLERVLISSTKALSFHFLPSLGWALKDVRIWIWPVIQEETIPVSQEEL